MSKTKKHKKPQAINLELPLHRAMTLRAYFSLLTDGKPEEEAERYAAAYALRNWEELDDI